MAIKKNFFNFNFIHPYIVEFSQDLERSQRLYNQSYHHLKRLDEVEQLHASGDAARFEKVVTYYRETCQLQTEMKQSHNNLVISYYAFRTVAKRDSKVMQEFKKMPDDFAVVDNLFITILEQYQKFNEELRKLI